MSFVDAAHGATCGANRRVITARQGTYCVSKLVSNPAIHASTHMEGQNVRSGSD